MWLLSLFRRRGRPVDTPDYLAYAFHILNSEFCMQKLVI